MNIVFTSFYKTYFKDNTRNYVTNYYVLVFLISVKLFFLLIIWDIGSISYEMSDVYRRDPFKHQNEMLHCRWSRNSLDLFCYY